MMNRQVEIRLNHATGAKFLNYDFQHPVYHGRIESVIADMIRDINREEGLIQLKTATFVGKENDEVIATARATNFDEIKDAIVKFQARIYKNEEND